MKNIYGILEGLNSSRSVVNESLGDNDIVTVSPSSMAREIEKKFSVKYMKQLESLGTDPDFDVYVRTEDDRDLGINDILDNISINIYFDSTNMDSKMTLNKIKQIFKKYSFADFRYSNKDDSYFIEVFGMDDSFDMIEVFKSDGMNLSRFYSVISKSRDELDYEDREYKRMLRNLPR